MFRSIFLNLSHATWARRAITRFGVSRRAAARFIAGETPDEAIRVICGLNERGIHATVDHLGENVQSQADAARSADDYLVILDRIATSGVKSHASVKLTQLGLDLGVTPCLNNLRCILECARGQRNFVRVDMEGTAYTDRTLEVVHRLRSEHDFDNVGAVIQAYLYRSEQDIHDLNAAGIRVRLCKGAYQEPPDKAYPLKKDVDANYVRLTQLLLDALAGQDSGPDGLYPAFATHDIKMIEAVKDHAAKCKIPAAAYEFQMLLGIRRDLQDTLVQQGYNVRVYVPYGTEWYPYYMRRLAERPANLWFLVTNFVRG
jgi:proline dehydrogenase